MRMCSKVVLATALVALSHSFPKAEDHQASPQVRPQERHQERPMEVANLGGGFIEMLFTGNEATDASPPTQQRNTYAPQRHRARSSGDYRSSRGSAEPDAQEQAQPRQQGRQPQQSHAGRSVGYTPYQQAYHHADEEPSRSHMTARPAYIQLDPEFERQEVTYRGAYKPGTIVIDTKARHLYLVQGGGRALRYGVGVGRPGFEWRGQKTVTMKREWPDWRPPAEMLQRRPDLPRHMKGGPDNPLGARALYLGTSLYRIHGSNEPETIGQAVSSGCIRMRNEDVIDLYDRVRVGTSVVVL